METSAVNWLWKVIQEHLKSPLNSTEWQIALEFARGLEMEGTKKAYIEGAISVYKNIQPTNCSNLTQDGFKQKLKTFISEHQN